MSLKSLADIGTIILTICAVLVTGLVVRRELFDAAPRPAEPREISNWERLAATGHRSGPADAPIQILEFSDFQCPFCRRVQDDLRALRERHPSQVTTVFRHFPLESIHPHARAAAGAAECAAEQGRFSPMREALFANQQEIGVTGFDEFARRAGVEDIASFGTCLSENRYEGRVTDDANAAWTAGLRSTPSIIVNGTLLPGTPTREQLLSLADSLLGVLAHASAPAQSGSGSP